MGTFADVEQTVLPASASNDFWRSGAGTTLPNGVTDTTDAILHQGLVALGAGAPLADPVASLDVFRGARSGTDGRVVGVTPMYVTGTLPQIGVPTTPPATPTGGAEFRHSNQTQGVGVAFDGLYATGSNADQHLGFLQRGQGQISFFHQTLNAAGSQNYSNWIGPAITANQGWTQRHFAAGTLEFNEIRRRSALALPGGGVLGNEIFFQKRVSGGGLTNALALRNSLCAADTNRLEVAGNEVADDKLVLFGQDQNVFFGFGIKSSTLASFISSNAGHFRFYQGACPGTQVFGVSGIAIVTVDPTGLSTNDLNNTGGSIRFGGDSSTEYIKSNRTVGQNNLVLGTNNAPRVIVRNNGLVNLSAASRPVFANDGAAGAGGLVAGDIYRDALGLLHVKL